MRRLGWVLAIGSYGLPGAALLSHAQVLSKAQIPADVTLAAAETLIGKALFLRGFYVSNDLLYDASGRVQGSPKTGDWTLTGVNILKAVRRNERELELDGIRVAIRYNPDAREFQRHPFNDEKVRIIVADPGDLRRTEAAFGAIFAIGIDPELQRSMPDYWRHYFDPNLAWPQDELTGQMIYTLLGPGNQTRDVTPPKVEHRADARYTSYAQRDKVQAALQLRLAIDAQGVPHRISVLRPLGYGLDQQAVEAVEKWRFAPATLQGKPVAAAVAVEEQFSLVPFPH